MADQIHADPLIERVLSGETAAQDAFYRREHPPVYRICLGFLTDSDEAADVAQDSMLHLIDHLDRYDPSRRFTTWRNTVTANLCRDRLRRIATRRRIEEAAAPPDLSLLPDPSDVAATSEIQGILFDTLSSLTDREREVFVLRDLEGVPSPEVADALGVAEGTVRSLLCLARRRLRTLLGPRLPELAGGVRADA